MLGISWSPNHQQIVLRMSNGKTPADTSPYGYTDLNSELGVTSVDGGSVIPITPPNSGLWRSDAWWDASGNRLLYREEKSASNGHLASPQWILSQSDQPAGIARQDLPASVTLPAVNSDGSLIASIDANGRVLVGAPGSTPSIIATGAITTLPGSPGYPARPLWQPNTGTLLYAFASAGPTPDVTTLVLRSSSGIAFTAPVGQNGSPGATPAPHRCRSGRPIAICCLSWSQTTPRWSMFLRSSVTPCSAEPLPCPCPSQMPIWPRFRGQQPTAPGTARAALCCSVTTARQPG
jgi:hypothetical protein